MPIHRHEPISEEAMKWVSQQHTICETLREAYHLIDNEEARLKLRIATSMAKSMTAKLSEYKRNWRNGFWDDNEKFPVNYNRKPIDVLFLCWDDNSNTMYRFWQCARHLGLNSVMFKGKPHPFGYPMQAPIHPSLASTPICMAPTTVMAPGLESLINSAHVIHLGASTYPMAAVNWSKLNVVVQHGGSVYRQNPGDCNDLFNSFCQHTVIQCPDLLGLGARNESWIYYPVDTVKLKPDFSRKGDKLVVGHFPSNSTVKGTDAINKTCVKLDGAGLIEYRWNTDILPWPSHLQHRVAQCDIIIEGCNAKQGDKTYGEWGNAALEAAALGCIVVTHCVHKEQYSKEFGDLGVLVANNEQELERVIRDLLALDPEQIVKLKRNAREWVERNHSIPATAARLWDKVYRGYFE
jgi:hypothetical protein